MESLRAEAAAPLKAAIIGCGRVAGGYDERTGSNHVLTHAKAYRMHPQTRLSAATDPRESARTSFGRRWEIEDLFADPREMLETIKPDIVSICTPDDTHAEILDLCRQYPLKAVWCEKPLATDVAAAESVVSNYETRGIPLAVNYHRRWDGQWIRVRNGLLEGRFGRVQNAVLRFTKGIRHNGSHGIDLLIDLLGPVHSASVLGGRVDFSPDDPTLDVRMEFETGAVAYVLGSDERLFSIWELDLLAEKGRVRFSEFGHKVELFCAREDPVFKGYRTLGEGRAESSDLDTIMLRVLHGIIGAVMNGGRLPSDGRSALETLRVCNELIAQWAERHV